MALAFTAGAQFWLFAGYDPTTGCATLPGTTLPLGGKLDEQDESQERGERQHHARPKTRRGHGHDEHERDDD